MSILTTPRGQAVHVAIPVSAGAAPSFEQAAALVLGRMQEAFQAFLDEVPGGVRKAADLQRAFELDSKLAGQVFKVATAANPAAVCVNVPPRVSLERMLKAAAHRRVPAPVIARVTQSYEGFERLVESEASDRGELEAMLNAFLPEERAKQELAARQSVFKGMSQIKGLAAEAEFDAMFLHPSADGKTADRASLVGFVGLRRMRSDVKIRIGSGDVNKPESPILTIDGEPSEGLTGSFLSQFSTSPLPRFHAHESENGMMYYYVAGEEVGMRSAVDLVMADKRAATLPLYWEPGARRMRGLTSIVTKPVKRTTLDVFLHRDVYPDVVPQLSVYDTTYFGVIRAFNDPARENDRLHPHEPIRPILGGVTNARLPHLPRYVEMLEHVCTKLGWDAASFRGYRLDVHYPVYGAQYAMWFELPEAPGTK